MDDPSANQTPGESFNKIDLSALEAFQFGTQWTDTGDTKRSPSSSSGGGDRGRGSEGGAGPARRDRRPPRAPSERDASSRSSEAPHAEQTDAGAYARDRGVTRGGGDRYESSGRFDRRPRFDRGPGSGPAGGPAGGFRAERDRGEPRFDRSMRRPMGPPRPYVSPVFEVTFYPDDHGFTALVKAMRASCRTYELFEIARLILGKPERCVVVFRRRVETPGATPPPSLAVSVPSGLPFETEDEAINHALEQHLDQFFTTETVEVEPPKGSFQFVNRCPITKDLLGPPNYHRYPHILQQHYTTRGIRMPFEKYKASIEVVRDPEAINQWLESMKQATRYTLRPEIVAAATAGEPTITSFDNLEDARAYLLRTCRERLVRTSESARVAARVVEGASQLEAFRAMHGALETQRRFPLDTANALRGRLRRENFNIFKRGSKGVTYVCSVRRKFRQPGQVFSESIDRLIGFLDANPMVNVAELPLKFLGFAAAAVPNTSAQTGATEAKAATDDASTAPAVPLVPEPTPTETESVAATGPTPEQKAEFNRLMLDLRWLVTEGYVAEYSDGKLFAHPVVAPHADGQHEKGEQPVEAGDDAPGEHPETEEPASDATNTPSASASTEITASGEPNIPTAPEASIEQPTPRTESSAAT